MTIIPTIIQPFDDDLLVYDYTRHRYYLNEKAVFIELGINLDELPDVDANKSTLAQRIVRQACDSVYRYISARTRNLQWLLFEMACYEELRLVVYDVLLAQAQYLISSGSVKDMSGIDMYKGHNVSRDELKRAVIAPEAEDMLDAIQPCLGRSLTYAGYFGAASPDYEKFGY